MWLNFIICLKTGKFENHWATKKMSNVYIIKWNLYI